MSRERVRNFVESTGFHVFIFFVILVNSITIGWEISQFDHFVNDMPQAMIYFETFDFICLLIYIVEAALKLYAYRLKYFKSAWNLFDFAIILLSVIPALGIIPVPIQFLRSIRLVRAFRVLKIISLFDRMHIIVEAIGKSISSVVWTALLLLVVIYIFDVIGVAAFGADYPEQFGSLSVGAVTLVEAALDGWPDFAHEIAVNHPYGYLYFILYIVCSALIVLNVVVGIIVDAIQTSAQAERDEAARGIAPINAKNHVLVLGFNPTTLAILGELIEANRNQKTEQIVVVLDDADKIEMQNKIDEQYGAALAMVNTDIHCRTGSVYDTNALERCAIGASKSVIINAASDYDAIRAIMACTHCMLEAGEACTSFSIATVQDERNAAAAKVAGRDDVSNDYLELISMQSVIARIMVNASRQPGLSAVFTELFNFAENEFYIIPEDPCYQGLYGKTIAEINLFLKSAIAIGVMREGRSIVDNPNNIWFCEGDALILVEEDDDALSVLGQAAHVQDVGLQSGAAGQSMRALVLGNYPILQNVLAEFANYLLPGSEIMLADENLDVSSRRFAEAAALLADRGISFSARNVDINDQKALDDLLADFKPHGVLVLGDVNSQIPDEEDQRIIELILYLRMYRETSKCGFSIASQINSEGNRELIDVTGSDDYIVSKHFAALLMAQISQRREISGLINMVLSSEGYEVYMKKALHYIPLDVDLDLFSVGSAVAKRGEIFIGIRQKQGKRYQTPVVNPAKFQDDGSLKTYQFGEDDYFVVLAEDISFQAQ